MAAKKRKKTKKCPPKPHSRVTGLWDWAHTVTVKSINLRFAWKPIRLATTREEALRSFFGQNKNRLPEESLVAAQLHNDLLAEMIKVSTSGTAGLVRLFQEKWEKGLTAARVARVEQYIRTRAANDLHAAAEGLHVNAKDLKRHVPTGPTNEHSLACEIVGLVSGPVKANAIHARARGAPALPMFFDSIIHGDDGGLFFDEKSKLQRAFATEK